MLKEARLSKSIESNRNNSRNSQKTKYKVAKVKIQSNYYDEIRELKKNL